VYKQLAHTRNELFKQHRIISCSLIFFCPFNVSFAFFLHRQEINFNQIWFREYNKINKKLHNLRIALSVQKRKL